MQCEGFGKYSSINLGKWRSHQHELNLLNFPRTVFVLRFLFTMIQNQVLYKIFNDKHVSVSEKKQIF
jgi:hypothetical protein